MKKITFRNENRTFIETYCDTHARHLADGSWLDKNKVKAIEIFEALAEGWKSEGKTDYLYGAIQSHGEPKFALYEYTVKTGSTDWKAMAQALAEKYGEDMKALEAQFKKENTKQKVVKWATDKQTEELQ